MKRRRRSNTLQFEEEVFVKNARGIANIVSDVVLLMKTLQNKPQF